MPTNFATRLRMASILAIAVYPVVTLYLYALMPLSNGWTLWQRSLVLVPVMVATIVFVIHPLVLRVFGRFIAGRSAATGAQRAPLAN
jgi:antibiotic biosynthesis monooxygenase (ABM) superfamily enzyme